MDDPAVLAAANGVTFDLGFVEILADSVELEIVHERGALAFDAARGLRCVITRSSGARC